MRNINENMKSKYNFAVYGENVSSSTVRKHHPTRHHRPVSKCVLLICRKRNIKQDLNVLIQHFGQKTLATTFYASLHHICLAIRPCHTPESRSTMIMTDLNQFLVPKLLCIIHTSSID